MGTTVNTKAGPTFDVRCGTEAGYVAHRRRDESPCTRCRAAAGRARTERRYRDEGVPAPKGDRMRHCLRCGGYLTWRGVCHNSRCDPDQR